ncbi:MAG TPA: hotdog fold thioesterase [Caldithrix abyssi]|uniref:Hotdog fold thioesterase n=1 Tax=Caldithrix abyssi TaxID=187145 RepID=A0A7V5UFY6_CALAY|nr:hotdog fold thioesterase [Caldithrix abyssi]
MVQTIGIEYTAIGDDYLTAIMPVDRRTKQPAGLLHGGASVALAETLGSVASYLCVDAQQYDCVGLEINASHLRAVREGTVRGTARPIKLGKRMHVWEIKISDDRQRLVCVSRLTVAVVPKNNHNT